MNAVEMGFVKNIRLLHHDGRKWAPLVMESHITLPGAVRKIFKEDLKKMKTSKPAEGRTESQPYTGAERKCLRNVIKRGQNGN